MRVAQFVLLLAFCTSARSQTPTSFTLNVSIPADPARSLGAANGLMPIVVDFGSGNLTPGGFFTVAPVAQFADGRMGFTCGMIQALVSLRLQSDSGVSLNVRTFALPKGYGTPRAGCEPVAAVMPLDAPPGAADLIFSYPQINATARVRIAPEWVALMTPLDQALTRPYVSGDTVYLRTAGLGIVALEEVTIVAGGIPAPVISREPDPELEGFDRISFRMPDDAAETCYLPVYLRTLTGETSPVFVPKANQPGSCRHPWNLEQDALATLDNGGRIWAAQPSVSVFERESLVQGSVIFQQVERWRMALIAAPEDSRACRILPVTPLVVTPDVMRTTLGDGGSPLGLVSPDGQVAEINSQPATLNYFKSISKEKPYGGEWVLQVPGGPDIGAFETRVSVPNVPDWIPPERIDRSSDLVVTWNAEGLTSLDRLSVAMGSGFGPFIECRTTGDAGTVTIPVRYLRVLPANPQGLVSLQISRPFSQRAIFQMPLANGSTGLGVFDYRLVSTVRDVPIE